VREAPWQIAIFSLSMYWVVYGLRNEGLTGYITGLLDIFASYGVWGGNAWHRFSGRFLIVHHE
jgi:arsenical pump membrane protein